MATASLSPEDRTPSVDAFHRELRAARRLTIDPSSILIAEDDAEFRETLEISMHGEFPNAMIECVGDGAAAFDAFRARRHSAAIFDLSMPRLDGMELTARVRRESLAVPIVVVTASGGPEQWKHLSALGADGFLLKPVNMTDVATLLRRALAER